MVGYAAPPFRRSFGGAYVEVAVQLHGIAVHDFAVELLGQIKGEAGFARRGRTDHRDQRRGWGHVLSLGRRAAGGLMVG